jgi:hypothetical protein
MDRVSPRPPNSMHQSRLGCADDCARPKAKQMLDLSITSQVGLGSPLCMLTGWRGVYDLVVRGETIASGNRSRYDTDCRDRPKVKHNSDHERARAMAVGSVPSVEYLADAGDLAIGIAPSQRRSLGLEVMTRPGCCFTHCHWFEARNEARLPLVPAGVPDQRNPETYESCSEPFDGHQGVSLSR